jgi:hypothetical protein
MNPHEGVIKAPVTEKQIATWTNEGGAVGESPARGPGRPGRGSQPSQVIAVRLTLEEIAAVDERARRPGKSRSDVIRDALVASAL